MKTPAADLTRLSDQTRWTLTLDTTVQPKLRDSVTSDGQLGNGQTAYDVATVYDVEGRKAALKLQQ